MASEAGRRGRRRALALALIAAGLAPLVVADPVGGAPRTWHVDPSGSRLVVHVFRKGLLSPVLHDHHFVPESWNGTVTFDPERPQEVDVRVTVAADSLRDRQPDLSPADVEKVERQVRGPKVLDADRYPVIVFAAGRLDVSGRSSAGEGKGAAQGMLAGTLSLRGRTHSVRVPLRVRWSARSLNAEGDISFKQSEFGIEPYRSLLGAIAVQDRVSVEFTVQATAS